MASAISKYKPAHFKQKQSHKFRNTVLILLVCLLFLSGFFTIYYEIDLKAVFRSPESAKTILTETVRNASDDFLFWIKDRTGLDEIPKPKPLSAKRNRSEEEKLQEYIDQMTLSEKVGQMFIIHFPKDEAGKEAETYQPAGFVLFGKDFENEDKAGMRQKLKDAQKAELPLLFAVDEEGGKVNRISSRQTFRKEPFSSPQDLYEQGGWKAVEHDTREKCSLLKEVGINVNFAPVADVSTDRSDFIFERSFGKNADDTARYVSLVVKEMDREGIASTLKHFPGYGNNTDTHTGISVDRRPLSRFEEEDFVPFREGIASGADLVMVSHNVVNAIDPNLPASLSPKVHDVLRNDLAFEGVSVTDDLMMQGITSFTDGENPAVLAVLAGNDLLCSTNYQEDIPAVLRAAKEGQIPEAQIDQSVLRILKLKQKLGLLHLL